MTSAKRQPKMMDDAVQPRGSTGALRNNVIAETFGENPSATKRDIADETARHQPKLDPSAAHGRSETVREYQLWIRRDALRQSGQARR